MIANLVARPLAGRLARLASQHRAHFTQYLDDMTISGPEHVCRIKNTAIKIVRQEGFSISPNKIRISRQGQECIVTGVRVDSGLDAPTESKDTVDSKILGLQRSENGATAQEIASLKGSAAHLARLNPRLGKQITKRIKQLAR